MAQFMELAEVISVKKSVAVEMIKELWVDPAHINPLRDFRNEISLYELRRSGNTCTLLIIGQCNNVLRFLERYGKKYRHVRYLPGYAEIFPNFPLTN